MGVMEGVGRGMGVGRGYPRGDRKFPDNFGKVPHNLFEYRKFPGSRGMSPVTDHRKSYPGVQLYFETINQNIHNRSEEK